MPDAAPDGQPADELTGLLTERDALHRRLAWVDTQVTHLQRERQDDMVRRLASLEEAVLRAAAPVAAWPTPTIPATPAEPEAVGSTALGHSDEAPALADRLAALAASAPDVEHWSAPPSRPMAQPARPPAPPRPDTPPPVKLTVPGRAQPAAGARPRTRLSAAV